MSAWTHSICDECYSKREPGREPVRVKKEYRQFETCCFCGTMHESGIYYRHDPQLALCKGSHAEED